MSPMGLGTKNNCAGEDQKQFSRQAGRNYGVTNVAHIQKDHPFFRRRGGSTFKHVYISYMSWKVEPGWSSRYSDWLRAGRPRGLSSSPNKIKNFLFSMSSRLVLGPSQPPIQWVSGALSQGVQRPGCEADHSPLSSAEAKKTWVHTSTPPYAFMA
jgi:hypothetical protein